MGALPPRWGDRSLTVIVTVKFLLTRMRKKPSNTKSRLLLLSVKAKRMKGQVCTAAQVTGETAPYGRQNLHPSRHRAAAAPCLSQGATLRAALSSGNWSGRESASLQPVRRNRQRRGKVGPRDSSTGARLWGAAAPASTSQADKARWSVSSPQKSQDRLPLYRADPFPSATRRLLTFTLSVGAACFQQPHLARPGPLGGRVSACPASCAATADRHSRWGAALCPRAGLQRRPGGTLHRLLAMTAATTPHAGFNPT